MIAGAFQSDAFQNNAFQDRHSFTIGSGGSEGGKKKKKIDPQAWADVYDRADRLRQRIELLPAEVVEAAELVLEIPQKIERNKELRKRVKADNKFMRLYESLIDDYYTALLEQDLKRAFMEREERLALLAEEDEIMLMLLL